MKQKLKQTKGITLIALVITIIVLLILAGVSIAMLTGDNGILTQANNSKIQQAHGAVREGISLAYNEYQIEINTASNTKLASTEKVTIKGEEEKALANTSMTFLDFLKGGNEQKINYIKDGTENVLDVETLTGSKQALGNGADTDIYKIEEENGKYLVNYYGGENDKEEIWNVNNTNTDTGGLELEPDTGKEALILVYNVSAGETIELPYSSTWMDSENNEHDSIFNFTVDWGDGITTNGITSDYVEDKAKHTYSTEGRKEIIITGTFEVISSRELKNGSLRKGIFGLEEIKQWGTTGVKNINFFNANDLTTIATPTQNSFIDLVYVYFGNSGLKSIPENLFANCPNVTSFEGTFYETDITNIPENLFANCYNAIDFSDTFSQTNITSIPEDLFANCPNAVNFGGTFSNTEITSIPKKLFASCNLDNVLSFEACFANCSELTGEAPKLWLAGSNSEENAYKGMPDGAGCFAGSSNLEKYDEIPEYWREYNFPM